MKVFNKMTRRSYVLKCANIHKFWKNLVKEINDIVGQCNPKHLI